MILKNELGVIAVFCKDAHLGGFTLLHIQQACPDALVERNGIEYRVEFEFNARSFLWHGHDPRTVDLIICWENPFRKFSLPIFSLAHPNWYEQEIKLPSDTEREIAYWKYRSLKAERETKVLRNKKDIVKIFKSNPDYDEIFLRLKAEFGDNPINPQDVMDISGKGKSAVYELLKYGQEAGFVHQPARGTYIINGVEQ